jgi:hypothetical protein
MHAARRQNYPAVARRACSIVIWTAARRQKFQAVALAGSLIIWTMQSCNGRQAALEVLDLAGKGLNAFSVL